MFRRITRRTFNRLLGRSVAVAPIAGVALAGLTEGASIDDAQAATAWPSPGDWGKLQVQVKGRLIQPISPLAACTAGATAADKAACDAAVKQMANPFFIEDSPGATQSTGWLNAWKTKLSPYAVAAENTNDIVAAVNFAREHKVRLVVKGTGHDYFGRSNAADSLLVWTHAMRAVTSHDAFVPEGAPTGTAGVPAVSAQAGARWLEGYTEVTTKNGRYVQGGGCTSVGMAGGFMQGGGFGSFSRRYGTGAAGMLEVEVVTADGTVRVCNAYKGKDLFWALCGGGGGSFGIVTRVTLMTHEAPTQSGIVRCTIKAASDEAFLMLLQELASFWHGTLCSENWGEKVSMRSDNSVEFMLLYSGMDNAGATKAFAPLVQWARRPASACTVRFEVQDLPFRKAWDLAYFEKGDASMVHTDDRGGPSDGQFWWAGDQSQVSWYIWEYFGRYMPQGLLDNPAQFANTMFAATRHWTVGVHINKGLFGANEDAQQRTLATSMNPAVLNAAGLFIIAGGQESAFPGAAGHEPDMATAEASRAKMANAYSIVQTATPGAGGYVNESSYFDEDWGDLYWGTNYAKLLKIKREVDPTGLFTGHHLVGSEAQS